MLGNMTSLLLSNVTLVRTARLLGATRFPYLANCYLQVKGNEHWLELLHSPLWGRGALPTLFTCSNQGPPCPVPTVTGELWLTLPVPQPCPQFPVSFQSL